MRNVTLSLAERVDQVAEDLHLPPKEIVDFLNKEMMPTIREEIEKSSSQR